MADDFKIELTGVTKALLTLDVDAVARAAREALNKVAVAGMTEASKLIRSDFNIAAARLKQYLKLSMRAQGSTLQAVITGSGRGMALSYFGARQQGRAITGTGRGKRRRLHLTVKRPRGGAVSVQVKQTRKVLQPIGGFKPFLAQMPSGHIGVWVRTGRGRFPIQQRFGPGVGELFGTRRVMDGTVKVINDRFGPEFEHQHEYYKGRG
jgi:hypothetical protein